MAQATDPRTTHELDQLGAALRDLSPVLAQFQQTLYHNGMTRDEANRCARTLLREIYREAQRG